MTTYTEAYHTGEIILSEAPGTLSREAITVVSGAGALAAGTVLGKITKGAATAALVVGGTGGGTFSAVALGAGALPGVYQLIATAATKFNLEDPNGVLLGVVTLGVESTLGGLTFTFTAAGAGHVAGDRATITVAAGSGKYTAYDDALLNGAEVAAAILLEAIDATSGDITCSALVRLAEIKKDILQWHADADATAKTLAYARLAASPTFIVAR